MSCLPDACKGPDHLRLQREVYDMLQQECVKEENGFLDIEDANCDEEARRIWKNWLEEQGLTQTKIEGKGKRSFVNALLQHATGDYSQESFPEADAILETIHNHLDFETLNRMQRVIMMQILQKVNELKGTNLFVCILAVTSELKPIIIEEIGSRDGEPVLTYYSMQSNRLTNIIPTPLYNLVCFMCDSKATKYCKCGERMKRLQPYELPDNPNLVESDLASRMETDPSLIQLYYKELPTIYEATKIIEVKSENIKKSKIQLDRAREEIISHLEHIFSTLYAKIEETYAEINSQIKSLNKYKLSLHEEGRLLVQRLRSTEYQATLANIPSAVDIPLDRILEYLSDTLHMGSSNNQPSLQAQLFEGNRLINDLKRIIEEKTNTFTHRIANQDKIIQEKEFTIQELSSTIKEINRKNSSLQAESLERNHLINSLKSSIQDKDKRIKSLSDLNKNQILKIREYKNQISTLQAQAQDLQSQVISRENLSSQLEISLSSSLKEMNDIKLDLQNNSIRINEKNDEMNRLIDNQKSLNGQIEKLTEACRESENKINELNFTIQSLQQDHYSDKIITSKGRRYVYTPFNASKSLIQYDIQSEKAKIIDIPTLPKNFNATSSCELPNGDVLLAGFTNKMSNEAVIYKIATQEIITLPPLSYPRSFVGLFYYRGYVYAFGGKNSNRAERYSLETYSLQTLPNMKYKRSTLSCVGIDDKIYLFKGGYNNIEIFNTTTLQFAEFNLDSSDTNSSGLGIAYRVDDRVYLLTDNLIQVYDTSLNKLTQYSSTYKYIHYSIHNIIQYNNSIYYYNHYTCTIERIDTTLPILEPQHYSHNTHRYIYKTRENTKKIHRVDLEHSTIESIDLSTGLNRNFDCTSVCVMNNGDVIMAGFDNPVSGECYIFSPISKSCTRLPDLNTPRYNTTLLYHNDSVYVFGGRDSADITIKKAEKIDIISINSWTILPDMIQSRSIPSCIGVNNYIYIMGGDADSIEIYNINTNSYQLSQIPLNSNYVVTAMIDDQVHIIGRKNYKILTNNLEIVSDLQDKYDGDYLTYTKGNTVYYEGKIYFYNRGRLILERVNPTNFEREVQLITHRTKTMNNLYNQIALN
jgi:hypothetical protein